MKITNYKSQITNKFQIPNSKFQTLLWKRDTDDPNGAQSQLAVGDWQKRKQRSEEEKKRRKKEGEKIGLRFPQTYEATATFSIHINYKKVLTAD